MKEKININNKYMNIVNFRKLFLKMYILNNKKKKEELKDIKLLVMG